MTWFTEMRQTWIAEMVHVYGFINREHIERKFGVSTPQASSDLHEFQRRNPRALFYNASAKRYEREPGVEIIATGPAPEAMARCWDLATDLVGLWENGRISGATLREVDAANAAIEETREKLIALVGSNGALDG